MGVKVSVIVSVHNPGSFLDTCVEELLRQSFSPGEYELMFVDHGSNDGTMRRLEELSRRYPHLRALEATRTGGPGQPRNLGIERANGEYVYFLDPDDRLTPPALERMYAMAVRNDADIVVGKLVGPGAPSEPFLESRDQADLVSDHLVDCLTPHMLFRTALLVENELRFAEEGVWLEDERFVLEGYLHAKVISVLADDVCCQWSGRTSRDRFARRTDRRADYRSLRQMLDLVETHTRRGEVRDRIYARWYQTKMLARLGGRTVLGRPIRFGRYAQYREVRKLAAERFGPAVEEWLPVSMRVRAHLLRVGEYAEITRLERAERGLTLVPTLERIDWDEEELLIRVSGRLAYADGRPVTFHRVDGLLLWEPPVELRTDVPEEAYDVTTVLTRSRLNLYLQNRDDSGDYRVSTSSHLVPDTTDDTEQVTLRGTARLDPRRAKLGRPLDQGLWDCFVRVDSCGWTTQRRIPRPSLYQTEPPCPSQVIGSAAQMLVEPYWTKLGNLGVRITAV
ncbi:glycosyltransferase family 2 protein [Actinopolymorpha pittospori]|uniref:Glycosyltransferase involved in cell wall biosynthesis n=1 Tax=Actinopolymorpha pittospori TaxID=648752 RepID=A0A927RJZ9_9ACTN|nr:glycosyltransferase family A protein [Actinopolymorpha pittospori]MBE1606198.1 glycosyltransferase involved in cell wall biosynthesis [Actinopolymorpha pittospori]